MRLTYDPRYNVAYIRIRDESWVVETVRISDEMNIDLSSDGKVCGIELLDANEQLFRQDQGKFVVTNSHTGAAGEPVVSGV
ncbi:MAG: DUF2283 domain-containing protein [Magnetococcales bacterium]|nr:DUF2283 domain-containing protein [Magnetococcales bacterium]